MRTLIALRDLRGFDVRAKDAELGRVREFYFHDRSWLIRYFIVTTSRWLGRNALIAPDAVTAVDQDHRRLLLDLTHWQVEQSPPIDFDKPVSRQEAEAYYGYYGWPAYWVGSGFVGFGTPQAPSPIPVVPPAPAPRERERTGDPHLRSFQEITGYRIHATDGEIGHVEDLLVDIDRWAIRYVVVDTRNWWPGKKVLILPHFVHALSWSEQAVSVDLGRAEIEAAPPFDSDRPLTRADELRLHAHYGLNTYWPVERASAARG
jgi:sporulation protein YlmC with PRC-barrel domain